ncbi:MAG: response regulator [Deltaproteobacteria bacterium]|nr:response regulator [Deltaproteobacteria bacterium]
MKELVQWLIEFEGTVADLYSEASEYFAHDSKFSELLKALARDEKSHEALVRNLASHIEKKPEVQTGLSLDKKFRNEMSLCLNKCRTKLQAGNLKEDELLQILVHVELCEYNHQLTYLIEAVKETDHNFTAKFAGMQSHIDSIKNFIDERLGKDHRLLKKVHLPLVWQEKILVLDKSQAFCKLLANILGKEGAVSATSKGQEALEKVFSNYYRLILSEMHLQDMSGIQLYSLLAGKYPDIGKRFLFITSDDSVKNLSFFRKNNLNYLIKPVNIKDIINTVAAMM